MPKAARSTSSEENQDTFSTSNKVELSAGRDEREGGRVAVSTSKTKRVFLNRQTSCSSCKVRKVKCSRQLPCAHCSMRSEECMYPGEPPLERADTLTAARMEIERLTTVVENLRSKSEGVDRVGSDEEEPTIAIAENGSSPSAPSGILAPSAFPPLALGYSSYPTTGELHRRPPTVAPHLPAADPASSVFSYDSFQASYHALPRTQAPRSVYYPPFQTYHTPSFHPPQAPPASSYSLPRPPPSQFHYALLATPSSHPSRSLQYHPAPYIPPPSLPVAHAPPLPGEESPSSSPRKGQLRKEDRWSWCSEDGEGLEEATEEKCRREERRG